MTVRLQIKIGLITRIRLAFKVFMLQPFEETVLPLHYSGGLYDKWECDNKRRVSECKNNGTTCLSTTVVEFKINESDHYHVCDDCAKKYTGQFETENFGDE